MHLYAIYTLIMALCAICFALGQEFPASRVRDRLIARGQWKEKMRLLGGFIREPWECVYVRSNLCTSAELICGMERIALADLSIPEGAYVSFSEYLGGAPHPSMPFLGGLERELQMSVTSARRPDGIEDDDD